MRPSRKAGEGRDSSSGRDSGDRKGTSRMEVSRRAAVRPALPRRRGRGLPLTRKKTKPDDSKGGNGSTNMHDGNEDGTALDHEDTLDHDTSPATSSDVKNKINNRDGVDHNEGNDTEDEEDHGTDDEITSEKDNSKAEEISLRSAPSETHAKPVPPSLIAVMPEGKNTVAVRVSVLKTFIRSESDEGPAGRRKGARQMRSSPDNANGAATLDGTPSGAQTVLGHDGNLFYCHVCKGFGDVVCCDGCPHVYHRTCIPTEDPSRVALDSDDDPWYCPDCSKKKSTKGNSPGTRLRSSSMDRRAGKKKCVDCKKSDGKARLKRCGGCGARVHFPSCPGNSQEPKSDGKPLCSSCQAQQDEDEQDGIDSISKKRKVVEITNNGDHDHVDASDVTNSEEDNSDDDLSVDLPKKMKIRSLNPNVASGGPNADGSKDGAEESSDDSWHLANKNKKAKLSSKKQQRSRPTLSHSLLKPGLSRKERPLGKRKRGRPPLTIEEKKKRAEQAAQNRKEKKRQKKRSRAESFDSGSRSSPRNSPTNGEKIVISPRTRIGPHGVFRATPAFFFFLSDNRLKIERVLSRKKPLFNRLPKGLERNELIAREAALWWVKARPNEHHRYMNLSMRDYEEKVISWKEEKNIKEMLLQRDTDNEMEAGEEAESDEEERKSDHSPEDDMITFKNHQRLYKATSVGCKPFTPEPGKSNNRVILELLQDMRFHPLPMFNPTRDADIGQPDYSKMTIPFFEVHGPVATSVGDECLGCTRGWNHFCHVLQRKFPAVEHRARLQPPLSSLIGTRIGIGLQKRWPDPEAEKVAAESLSDKSVPLFTVRKTPESVEAENLAQTRTYHLSNPSARADDIVQFVEEAVAMKVPEPAAPQMPQMPAPRTEPATTKKSFMSRGLLPTRGRKKRDETVETQPEHSDDGNEQGVKKCGRCRTIIRGNTGCIQCRRAQLVINMSKRQPPPTHSKSPKKSDVSGNEDASLVKVISVMCGRVNLKETNFDKQSDGDKAISSAMTSMRWTPNIVMPPKKVQAPSSDYSNKKYLEVEDKDSDDSESGDSDTEPSDESSDEGKKGTEAKEDEKKQETPVDDQKKSVPEVTEHRFPLRGRTRPQRSTRLATADTESADKFSSDDRQEMAKLHQEEAIELQKRCLSIACSGILLAMMRRDPLLLFAEPVPASVAGYTKIVQEPIDFSKIRFKVLNDQYSSFGSFISDARLLCVNALKFNPAGSIYAKVAKELYDVLQVMQKRASDWMGAIKDAHATSFSWRRSATFEPLNFDGKSNASEEGGTTRHDPFQDLRRTWPEAVEMLENGNWARTQIAADFMRTKENEFAYYGAIAVRRAAEAAEASLAPYPDSGGTYNAVVKRSHLEDEALRKSIDEHVANVTDPVQLKEVPTWREEAVIRILRRVQSRRVEGRISSENGCARCDGMRIEQEAKMAMTADAVRWGRNKKKGEIDTLPRVHESRLSLSTGLASRKARKEVTEEKSENGDRSIENVGRVSDVSVSVRGSGIHGWGLFADQPFKKGVVVAEYIGEYISNPVADAREKMYQEQRIQDYQFRVDENLVIDATLRGGHGRYINHNCNPNCIAKIIDGEPPNKNLKRVLIVSQRDIKAREEITYDYQFPLELDLEERIPCNCGSLLCRGFMNWDLPEKGSKNRIARTQKRGGNMRDRIRRLGRPLKK